MSVVQGNSQAIRNYVLDRYISPARKRGDESVKVSIGAVVREMKLWNRTPQVCSALRAAKFLTAEKLEIEAQTGPPSGVSTSVVITYRLAAKPKERFALLRSMCGMARGMGLSEALLEEREAFSRDAEEREAKIEAVHRAAISARKGARAK